MNTTMLTMALSLLKQAVKSDAAQAFIKEQEEHIKNYLKEKADAILDKAEDWIADSETQIDDMLALPVINFIREKYDIPDNDDVETDSE